MGWPVTIDTTIKDVFDIFKEILVRIFKIVYWILICLGFVITIPYYRNKKSKQCSKLVMFRQKITACFKVIPFVYVIPFAFLISLILYFILGKLLIRLVTILQYGF